MIAEAAFVPVQVAWFWAAALVDGNVPFLYDDGDWPVGGIYEVTLDAAPRATCPDDDVRMEFTIAVLAGARRP